MTLISIAPILAASGYVSREGGNMPLWGIVLISIPILITWAICVRFLAKMEDKP